MTKEMNTMIRAGSLLLLALAIGSIHALDARAEGDGNDKGNGVIALMVDPCAMPTSEICGQLKRLAKQQQKQTQQQQQQQQQQIQQLIDEYRHQQLWQQMEQQQQQQHQHQQQQQQQQQAQRGCERFAVSQGWTKATGRFVCQGAESTTPIQCVSHFLNHPGWPKDWDPSAQWPHVGTLCQGATSITQRGDCAFEKLTAGQPWEETIHRCTLETL